MTPAIEPFIISIDEEDEENCEYENMDLQAWRIDLSNAGIYFCEFIFVVFFFIM